MTFLRDWVKVIWDAVIDTGSGWSRAFWLYCALVSLAVFPVGIGQIARAPTFSMNRVGPVTAERGELRVGIAIFTFGTVLTGVCLVNAYRART